MIEVNQVYKCEICGNIVEMLHAGSGQIVCCGQNMTFLKEKTLSPAGEEGQEKHVPIIEKQNNKVIVKVGDMPHPMEDNHYIEWIELIADGKVYRKNLKPGMKPVAEFEVTAQKIEAREYCTVHGLWKSN